MGGVEILPSLDFHNLNNSSVVLSEVESFGGRWEDRSARCRDDSCVSEPSSGSSSLW